MKKFVIFISVFPQLLFGQGVLNNGGIIYVSSGTSICVKEGGVKNQASGAIENGGTILVENDWEQTTGATYNGTGTIAFKGSINQNLMGISSVSNLVIDNGNELILNNDLSISTELSLTSGKLKLGSNTLTIANTANISNADNNNYIVTNGTGTLKREVSNANVVFPIGNATYNPVNISNTGTIDNFMVRVSDNISAGSNDFVNRTWKVSEETNGGSIATLSFQWNEVDELASFDRTQSGVSHFTSGAWTTPTYTAATNVSGTQWKQSLAGVTSFSPFTIASDGAIFPITLLDFSGHTEKIGNLLAWTTSNELQSSHFDIERSFDGNEFSKIGERKAAGSSNLPLNYNYLDAFPSPTRNYYRLKMFDIDGGYAYSNTIELSQNPTGMTIYPNPATISVVVSANFAAGNVITLSSITGQIVYENVLDAPASHVSIPVEGLSKGVYFVRVLQNHLIYTEKLVVE